MIFFHWPALAVHLNVARWKQKWAPTSCRQTNKQINKRRWKYNLLGGGKIRLRYFDIPTSQIIDMAIFSARSLTSVCLFRWTRHVGDGRHVTHDWRILFHLSTTSFLLSFFISRAAPMFLGRVYTLYKTTRMSLGRAHTSVISPH